MNNEKNEKIDFSAFEQEIATFTSQQASSDTEGSAYAIQNDEPVLFPFNPNNAAQEDLIRLGLSPKVATTVIHFREKGGRFFKKEDLKKIYGLKATDYERLEKYITLENTGGFSQKNYGTPPQYKDYNNAKNTPRTIELKTFDPNTATENELLGFGLEEKTVKVLLKYREKGGVFRTKEDLKKVYGLSDIDFLRINQYVQIAENQFVAKERAATTPNGTLPKKAENAGMVTIDLNRANLDDFLVLRGIGRTFAARIIEHRERLGGFSSLNQLKEVYGLPDSTLHSIIPSLRLTASPYRKILVNKSTIEELIHPYLSRKQAEVIVRYRVNHGSFKNMEDLKKTGILTDIMVEKLQAYINFD